MAKPHSNKEQLKIATEVALDIRAVYHDLQNIPLAENPDCPTDEDFIRLGQWFLDANTVIKAEIARWRADHRPKLEPLSKNAQIVYDLLDKLPPHKALRASEILDAVSETYGKEWDEKELYARVFPQLRPYGLTNKRRFGYWLEKQKSADTPSYTPFCG